MIQCLRCQLALFGNPICAFKRKVWVEKWSQTDMDYLNNCVFVDESAFDINMRPATARSASGTPAIVTTPSTRAVSHTILGAISAMGVVNIEIRLPNMKPKKIKVDGARKRKQPQSKKAVLSLTTTCCSCNIQWISWTSIPK
ncbi:hypothetical protein FB192DRAFT_1280410 [Mucor lusitanicus]|uniref:Uncharacterized protein n=1 Tax=Mucor circinelloides f. lusitanicus TaxID=29924 RepID=A0A8H4BI56_MUCCL|nr:hypothetical protein FB192DRAFT_1280410 [Mucor lusitanicus]